MKHIFSRESKYLPLILKLNLTLLVGIVILAFILPLSGSERWVFVLPAATLAGITWAFIDHLNKR